MDVRAQQAEAGRKKLDEFKRKKAAALAARQRASQTASGQSTAVNSSSRAPVSAPGDEQQNAAQATPPAAEFHTSPAIGSHSASTKTQPVLRGNGTDFFEEHTPPSQGFAQSTGSWQQPAVSAVGSTTKASESSAPTKKPQTKSPSPEAESRFEPEKDLHQAILDNGHSRAASLLKKEADALRTQVDLLKSRLLDTDNAHQQELTSLREQHKVDAQQLREKAEDSAKLQQEWQALQDQVSDLEAANTELEDSNTQIEAALMQSRSKCDQLQNDLKAQRQAGDRTHALEAELKASKADIQQLKEATLRAEKEQEESLQAAEELAERLGEVQSQHAEEIDQLQRQMRGTLQSQRAAEEKAASLEQQVKDLESTLAASEEKQLRDELQKLQAEAEHLRLSSGADAQTLKVSQAKASRASEEATEAKQELEAALRQLEAAESEGHGLKAELKALQEAGQSWGQERGRLQSLEAELAEARSKVGSLQEEGGRLAEKLKAAEQSNDTRIQQLTQDLHASQSKCKQAEALTDEHERELAQTWQQLRELKLSYQELQLEAELQTQAAQEATQDKDVYMTELEELVSQHEALLTEKAAVEDQLQQRGDSEQTASAQLQQLEEENASLQKALEASRKDAQKEAEQTIQRARQASDKEISELRRRAESTLQQLSKMQQDAARFDERLQVEQQRRDDAERKAQEAFAGAADSRRQLSSAAERAAGLRTQLDAAKAEATSARKEVDAANSRASKAEEALAEAQEQAAQQLQSQKFSLDQLRRESEEVVRSLEEERDTLTAQMSVAQASLQAAEGAAREHAAEVDGARSAIDEWQVAYEKLKQQLEQAQEDIEIAGKEREQAWAELEQVKQTAARNAAVQPSAAKPADRTSNAKLRELQTELSQRQTQLLNATSQIQALQAELDGQQKRVKQLQSAAATRLPGSAALTNKKDEDDVYDIEAAVLTGAGGSFKPLSGAMRGAVFPLNTRLAVAAAKRLDKLAVAVDRRPVVRGLLLVYFVLLHLFIVLF